MKRAARLSCQSRGMSTVLGRVILIVGQYLQACIVRATALDLSTLHACGLQRSQIIDGGATTFLMMSLVFLRFYFFDNVADVVVVFSYTFSEVYVWNYRSRIEQFAGQRTAMIVHR